MNPKQLLLLLNPRSQAWSAAPGKQPGQRSGLRWEDVASALAMGHLDQLSYYLTRVKYCGDSSSMEALLQLVLKEARELSCTHQWSARQKTLQALAQLACYESIDTQLCKQCGGRGYSLTGKPCRQCRGLGRQPMSARARYRLAGVDKRNWERRWVSRYEVLYQKLCEAESNALTHLSDQLNARPPGRD